MPDRAGFTLVEALVALVLVGFLAVAMATAQAWAERATAGAEAQEEAAAAAELVLDSIAGAVVPASGRAEFPGLLLEWTAVGGNDGTRVRLRVRARGRTSPLDELYGMIWAPPPPPLGAVP